LYPREARFGKGLRRNRIQLCRLSVLSVESPLALRDAASTNRSLNISKRSRDERVTTRSAVIAISWEPF
jgi:hypothetical protein